MAMKSDPTNKKKKGKRGRGEKEELGVGVFDAVNQIESEDARAERKRRATGKRDRQRSEAAQSQVKIFGSLMECRILLQRVLQTVRDENEGEGNDEEREENEEKKDDDDDDDDVIEQTNKMLIQLLEARKLLSSSSSGNKSEEDEDATRSTKRYKKLIRSCSGGDNNTDNEQKLESMLQSEYDDCRNTWKEVLDRRYKDVRLHAGLTAKTQFRVLDSSFWQQIESTVQHEQLQRQQHQQQQQQSQQSQEQQYIMPSLSLFDDSKVYQQMLKDFVTTGMAGGVSGGGDHTAAAQIRLRKQQQQQQKKQAASAKAAVDRKASKGRKLRYQEIPKLVNFTFPLSRPSTRTSGAGDSHGGGGGASLNEDEWFQSLFGGVGSGR